MKLHRVVVLVSLSLVLGLGVAAPVVAQGPPVLQVFLVEVAPKDVDGYMAQLKEAQTIVGKLGLSGFRVFQSTAAGPQTGSIIISVESKDMMDLAKNQAKLQADPGWRNWVAKSQKSGLGTIVSNSLMVEQTARTK